MSKLKELENLFIQGKINRREFLAKVSALGLTAAVSPALLSMPAFAGTPKKGGRLRLGIVGGSTSDSLDPATINASFNQTINWQLRNNMVEIDHKGNVIPELAESWEHSPDASKWIFKLRKGVEFHDGKSLDAEDVVFSINHHRKKGSKSPARGILKPIKDVKADGKHTVVFTMHGPYADTPYLLSVIHLSIIPAGTTDFKIGTGGYKFVSFEPGVKSLTKRNPNYWKEGRAHFDEVEVKGIRDVNARTNALMTGQIDVMNWCDLKTIDRLKKKPGIQIANATGRRHFTFSMRCDTPPYDNKDIRLAMKYAIDREVMLERIQRGYGVLANDHPIPPHSRYCSSKFPQRWYDPDKARYHLKKTGLEGHVFELHTAPNAVFTGAIDAALFFRQQASKAGINIKVVTEPDDGYWADIWGKKPFFMDYWSCRPTPDLTFSLVYAADAKWNMTHWIHERFNKLLLEARSELDDPKRQEIYGEMETILNDDGGAIIPVFSDWVDGATAKLKHGPISGHRELDGHRLPERWWFA